MMPPPEEALFDGHPVAHVVVYYDRMRAARRSVIKARADRARKPRRP
jgi:hypothetical protein